MIPLYKAYMPNDLPELSAILNSGALAYGKYGKEFEQKLSEFIGNNQLITLNSFSSSVLVALLTIGIKPGDEVIASPMACLASNQPFTTMNVKVVWADVDPLTGTLNPESVKRKITSSTRAIFHNHFCGYPGYIDEINLIGKEYGIIVVDDTIEAFGSEYKGEKIGNVGSDVTIFSFQAVRLPTTIDGGAIAFKNRSLYEKSRLIRDSGIERKYFRDELGEINPSYDITTPGFGATLSDVNSYIGLIQLERLPRLLEKQRNNAETWKSIIIEKYTDFYVLGKPFQNPNYWIFGLLVPEKKKAIQYFREEGFYASGVHFPNNNYSVFGKHDRLPGVDEFYSRFVALPSGWWVTV